jgi:16S rRNA (cytidine1402-2'-O)-methyltransferase
VQSTLYLIPSSLGTTQASDYLPERTLTAIRSLRHFIAENAKTARAFLKTCEMPCPQSELEVLELDKHDPAQHVDSLLASLLNGHDAGLLSEAGCPGVADPGADIVAAAHRKGIRVIPLVGPSSLLLALMASGLEGQRFCFHGYLPIDKSERTKRIQRIEDQARQRKETQLFIETPYRNDALFKDLVTTLSGETRLCLAFDLSLPTETIQTKRIAEWKKQQPSLNKRPCVFLIGI